MNDETPKQGRTETLGGTGNLLADMVLSDQPRRSSLVGLVHAPDNPEAEESFKSSLSRNLDAGRALGERIEGVELEATSWERAVSIVKNCQPIPWYLRDLGAAVAQEVTELPQDLLIPFRRLLFAAASDGVLGDDRRVNTLSDACTVLTSDRIWSISLIHSAVQGILAYPHQRFWRQFLEEALLDVYIGIALGALRDDFGVGRGMLAGFAGRFGLVVAMAGGTVEQARALTEKIAKGASSRSGGRRVYNCEALQISGLIYHLGGAPEKVLLGIFGALGEEVELADESAYWRSAVRLIGAVRDSDIDLDKLAVDRELFGLGEQEAWSSFRTRSQQIVRLGLPWPWMF